MHPILILKTGALGDVLRTTSILSGLQKRYSGCRVTWVTAPAAVDLVRLHPLVPEVVALDIRDRADYERVHARLALTTWDRLLSFDDEEPMCRLASSLPARRVSGAFLGPGGQRTYTPDTAPWYRMGLLSEHGKLVADQLKLENQKSHAAIYAEMLGVEPGKPHLPREPASDRFAGVFAKRHELAEHGPVVGLNTGAGGRWASKALTVETVADLVLSISQKLDGRVTFLLLGGPDEQARNQRILESIGRLARVVDAGTSNPLFDFSALISRCDVLLSSDSLALHIAISRQVRTVAFFAPTSAAEVDLFGRGEKVVSSAPDYCSYRPDADTTTLTVGRLQAAVLNQLVAGGSV